MANAARKRAEESAAEAKAEEERIRKEVENALGVTRRAVRQALGLRDERSNLRNSPEQVSTGSSAVGRAWPGTSGGREDLNHSGGASSKCAVRSDMLTSWGLDPDGRHESLDAVVFIAAVQKAADYIVIDMPKGELR